MRKIILLLVASFVLVGLGLNAQEKIVHDAEYY